MAGPLCGRTASKPTVGEAGIVDTMASSKAESLNDVSIPMNEAKMPQEGHLHVENATVSPPNNEMEEIQHKLTKETILACIVWKSALILERI